MLKEPKSQNVSFEKIEFEKLKFLKEITILKTSFRKKGTLYFFVCNNIYTAHRYIPDNYGTLFSFILTKM